VKTTEQNQETDIRDCTNIEPSQECLFASAGDLFVDTTANLTLAGSPNVVKPGSTVVATGYNGDTRILENEAPINSMSPTTQGLLPADTLLLDSCSINIISSPTMCYDSGKSLQLCRHGVSLNLQGRALPRNIDAAFESERHDERNNIAHNSSTSTAAKSNKTSEPVNGAHWTAHVNRLLQTLVLKLGSSSLCCNPTSCNTQVTTMPNVPTIPTIASSNLLAGTFSMMVDSSMGQARSGNTPRQTSTVLATAPTIPALASPNLLPSTGIAPRLIVDVSMGQARSDNMTHQPTEGMQSHIVSVLETQVAALLAPTIPVLLASLSKRASKARAQSKDLDVSLIVDGKRQARSANAGEPIELVMTLQPTKGMQGLIVWIAKALGYHSVQTKDEKPEIAEAASRITFYDFGFKTAPKGTKVKTWMALLDKALHSDGINFLNVITNKQLESQQGKYIERLERNHPGYLHAMFCKAGRKVGFDATWLELAEEMSN
jgi:hypothetical protein